MASVGWWVLVLGLVVPCAASVGFALGLAWGARQHRAGRRRREGAEWRAELEEWARERAELARRWL